MYYVNLFLYIYFHLLEEYKMLCTIGSTNEINYIFNLNLNLVSQCLCSYSSGMIRQIIINFLICIYTFHPPLPTYIVLIARAGISKIPYICFTNNVPYVLVKATSWTACIYETVFFSLD